MPQSNELQYEFNNLIVLQLKPFHVLLKSDSSERYIKSIGNTIAEVKTKNKLMKIVEKSSVGRKTVEEHMSNSFDRGLLDKHKIRAGETRANKK